MIIRQLNENDVFQHERVSSQSFIYSCDVDSNENKLPCGFLIGAFADDNKTLMADMEIENRTCFFGSGKLTCAAVGGVASKPEYRNRGSIRSIFNALFNNDEYRRGAEISLLYPFSIAYYKKFGYESVGGAIELKVPFTEFRNIQRCSDVFLYEEQDNDRFFELYNQSAKKDLLTFERKDRKYFTFNPYKTLRYTYVLNDYSAYITFSVDRKESVIFVKEIEFLNRDSLLKIAGFLRNFEGNQKYVVFSKLSESSPVLNLFNDEKTVSKRLFSVGSARVIDVEAVLAKKDYPMCDGSFSLKCIDGVERNNAVFDVSYSNGKGEVIKRDSGTADVILDICAASKVLLSGVRDASAAGYLEGVQINKYNDAFFNAFPFKSCFANDDF